MTDRFDGRPPMCGWPADDGCCWCHDNGRICFHDREPEDIPS